MMDEIGVICPKYQGVADDLFFLRSTPYSDEELALLDLAYPLIQQLHALNLRLSLENLATTGGPHPAATGTDCFALLDRDGKPVFKSPDWENVVAADLTLSNATAELSRAEGPATLPFSRGYVTAHPFDENFALSPAGRLILVFPGDSLRAPLRWDEVLGALHGDVLTPRELDICRLILQGHPTAGIATILDISPGTVKNHRKRMYRKLDITSERELFLSALSMISDQHT
ncbi:MAG: hypothetical protein GJ676_04965 [Rhodobacteraceae bacterium]|nr:hypothetical protein [Paracoccaceae bacterium]